LQDLAEFDEPPMFKELIADIWAAFYKTAPELKDKKEIHKLLHHNHNFMDKVFNDSFYYKHHNSTKMDEMLSIFGTMEMGTKVIDWFQEELKQNEKLQEKMDNLNDLLQNMHNNNSNNEDSNGNNSEPDGLNLNQNNVGDGDQINNIELEQAINDFTDALNQTIDENEKELEAEMNQAMENAKELNDNLKDMFGGYSKSGNNELLK